MKLNSITLAVIIIVLLFGGIGFSSAMNWWQTESQKIPATYKEGEAAGQYNPADIRGSYTFGQISDLFAVPLEDLQTAFHIPKGTDPAGYQVKSLEAQFPELPVEMGTSSVRMFVAFYHGLPYEISADEETYLFPEAAAALQARGKMTAEQAAYLETHIVPAEPGQAAPAENAGTPGPTPQTTVLPGETIAQPTPVLTEHAAPEKTVTGKTTFQDLLDWGVTQEAIEGIMGDAMPAPQTVIKDYATQKGLEFSSLKTQLQAEVNK